MARTKQTARRSTGGKAPKAYFTGNTPQPLTITDHTGNKVIIPGSYSNSGLGLFPFQVYILESAKSLVAHNDFADKLKRYIAANQACIRFNENCRWRLEIFTAVQSSVLECIHHHEKEKEYRKSVGLGPIMLNRKELIIVDTEDWQNTGLLSVEYTAQLFGRDGSERDFENHVSDNPSWEDDEEELVLPGLRKDLVVQRHQHVDLFAEHFLQKIWDDEGHEWALSLLMERNVALGWPDDAHSLNFITLPDKPVAKQITRGYLRHEKRPRLEDEDDDCEDEWFSYEEVEDLITYGEKCDPNTGMPKSIMHSMRLPATTMASSRPIPDQIDIQVCETVDSLGVKCVDCSHTVYAASNTHFSCSLYVIGQRTEPSQTLFALLDQNLLKRIPWKFHVYQMPSLASALVHHKDEMATRPLSDRSPISYTRLPEQPQSHIFLYLDEHTPLHAGPKFVTQDLTKTGPELEVLHSGSWDNAAQMLSTYLILCDESSSIMTSLNVSLEPSITASISLTPQHPNSESCREPRKTHLNLIFTLDPATPRAITINTHNSILTSNDYCWDSFLCIIDSDTKEEVMLPPHPAYLRDIPRVLSAEQLQHLSFPFSDTSPVRYNILPLQPGEKVKRTVLFESSCLIHRYREILMEGRRYDIVLKAGRLGGIWISVGRQDETEQLCWGNVEVVNGGEIARFIFERSREGEMGYPMPDCRPES